MKVVTHLAWCAALFAMLGAAHAEQTGYATAGAGLLSGMSFARLTGTEDEKAEAPSGQEDRCASCDSSQSGESCESCGGGCDTDCDPGWFAAVDFLQWKPRRRGLDFAIADPSLINFTLDGPVQSLELDSDSGVRASVGRLFRSGWDVTFTYTNFHTDDRAVAVPGPGGFLVGTRLNFLLGGVPLATAGAAATLDLDDFAVDAGYWFYPYDSISVRLFGGLRAATIGQKFAVNYQPVLGFGSQMVQTSQMDSFGVRLGGETHWYVRDNLSLFGRAAASVMVGDLHTNYRQTIGGVIGADADIADAYFQTIPVLEVAAGVNWQRDGVTIQAGYELATWFNLALDEAIIPDTSGRPANSSDLGLDGLFVRLIFGY